MHQPLVLQVFSDLGFDRGEITDHVGVAKHDSLGLGGGAGGENNFERIGGLNLRGTKTLGRMLRDGGFQIGGIDGCVFFCRQPSKYRSPFARTENQFRAHLRADAARKIRAGGVVDGDGDDSA